MKGGPVADIHGNGSTNGKKVVIQAIAIGAAAFVEQVLTETLQRLLDRAKARRRLKERQARIKPQH